MVPDVTEVRPGLANTRVRVPTVPLRSKSLKTARPSSSVWTVVVPPSAPVPVAMATVTATSLRAASSVSLSNS